MFTRRERRSAVSDKLKVLKDFCIVDDDNKDKYRKVLTKAVDDAMANNPEVDIFAVLDRVTHDIIKKKLDAVEKDDTKKKERK